MKYGMSLRENILSKHIAVVIDAAFRGPFIIITNDLVAQ